MPKNTDFQGRIADTGEISVTIPQGKTQSNIFDCKGMQIIAIETASNFTTGTLTFKKVGIDDIKGEASKAIFNADQSAYSISVEADGYYPIDPAIFSGIKQFKVICDSAQVEATTLVFSQIPLLH